jgi:hypothetical protein
MAMQYIFSIFLRCCGQKTYPLATLFTYITWQEGWAAKFSCSSLSKVHFFQFHSADILLDESIEQTMLNWHKKGTDFLLN